MRNFLNRKNIVFLIIFSILISLFWAGQSYAQAVTCPAGYTYVPESKYCRGPGGHTCPVYEKDGKLVVESGCAIEASNNDGKSNSLADYFVQALGIFLNTTLFLSIGPMILGAAAAILSVAGILFNQAIKFSVVDMAGYINNLEAIDVGWALFRDMINMGLIFILLYISIRTILGVGSFNAQKTISSVIIVALFINFSLFATRLIIDVSNVLAVGMYDNIVKSQNIDSGSDDKLETGTADEKAKSSFSLINVGLSGAIMKPLLLTAAFNTNADPGSPSIAGAIWSNSKGVAVNVIGDPWKIFITAIMGTVMMIVTAFVFFAGAIMFLIRFVVLIFVMVASPLAFGSLAFPGMNKQFDTWLNYLLKYSFFAPIYLFLIYFVAYFLNNSNIIKANDNWSIIINFVIAIVMMLTALIAANSFGIAGSKFAREWAGKFSFGAAAAFGRNTVGRRAYQLTQDKELLEKAAKGDIGARMKLSTAQFAAKSSFDFRNAPGMKDAAKFAGGLGDVDKVGAKGYAEVQSKKLKELQDYNEKVIGGGQGTEQEKLDRRKLHAQTLEKPTFMQRIGERLGKANKDEKGNVVSRGPRIRDILKDTYLAGDVAGYSSDIEASKKILGEVDKTQAKLDKKKKADQTEIDKNKKKLEDARKEKEELEVKMRGLITGLEDIEERKKLEELNKNIGRLEKDIEEAEKAKKELEEDERLENKLKEKNFASKDDVKPKEEGGGTPKEEKKP